MEFATDINSIMYAYIDRKKKLPLTTLFRAMGYETDRDILEIFGLADEVKITKAGMKSDRLAQTLNWQPRGISAGLRLLKNQYF
jgi:DNA-directed RNA polymerase beta subunit